MYQSYPHHRPRSRASYFLPFVSIILLGLIVVLVFQIVDYFQEKKREALENKAAVQIASGRAEMKIWGVEEWTAALDGSILHEGDSIRTLPGSRVILSLLNGSVIRLNAETETEISGLKSKDGKDEASLVLKSGSVWLKHAESAAVRTTLRVATRHLDVMSLGTVFSVEKAGREAVRVLDGKVNVAIRVPDSDNSKMRIAETLEVALGQEVSVSVSDILDLQNRKPLNLLSLHADEFRLSEWYTWNRREDASGNTGFAVSDAIKKGGGALNISMPQAPEPPPQQVALELSAPVVLEPAPEARTTKTGNVIVRGTVSSATEKVEVTAYIAGKAESYALQKYKSGSENWSYVASREYGNLFPGENRFTIVAVGKDGSRSSPAELVLLYDKPKEPADLGAPKILKFTPGQTTDAEEVAVEGSIGKGIVKIFVNDFGLTRYVPESLGFIYYAKVKYGNLKEGENEYSVYGVDSEGNKTPVTKFAITKKAAPAAAPAKPPPAPQPAGEPVL